MEDDVNLNNTNCITTYDEFGSTTYYNICNNTKTTLNWGMGEYITFTFLFLLILILVVCLITFIKDLFIKERS